MNDIQTENTSPTQDAREVVLEYVAEPAPYVAYYVQPRPLPGKDSVDADDAPPSMRRRGHRGLKIFLLTLAVLLALTLGVFAAWWFGLLPDVFYGYPDDFYSDDFYGGFYDEEDYDDVPRLPAASTDASVRLVYAEGHGRKLSIQEVYQKVNPSTVTVVSELSRGGASIGTGVIMTADGYIITNAHVISGAESCFIVLPDGQSYDAGLVGYDFEQDLAIIKALDASGLPAAEFGDSDALTVGDTVYAIGNPLGVELRGTLTDGIVSAINRDVQVDDVTMTLIQTNAALNNGNSGGPLINEYGQVIGINVLKMGMARSSSASVEGLGFAIPISSSAYLINDLLHYGETRGEPVLGIMVSTEAAYLPTGEQALRIYSIDRGSAGDKAGLQVDDLIVSADGVRIETSNDLLRVRHRYGMGETLVLTVYRDGDYLELPVVLEGRK